MQKINGINYSKVNGVDNLLIDASVLSRKAIESVTNANYVTEETARGRTPSVHVMDNVMNHITHSLIGLLGQFNPKKVSIAIDRPPYWRNTIQTDHYRRVCSFFFNPTTYDWAVEKDGQLFFAHYKGEIGSWVTKSFTAALQTNKKCNVKDIVKRKFETSEGWFYFEKGILIPEQVEAFNTHWGSEVTTNAWDWIGSQKTSWNYKESLDECVSIFPPYKGVRKWSHGKIISKAEFKEETDAFFRMFCSYMEIEDPIGVEGYEADDVIASLAQTAAQNGETFAITTLDQDLQQLVYHYEGGMWCNMRNSHIVTAEEITDRNQAKLAYYTKIIGGDSSDFIKGVRSVKYKKDGSVASMSAAIGATKALKFAKEYYDELETLVDFNNPESGFDVNTLWKNMTLINLGPNRANPVPAEQLVTQVIPKRTSADGEELTAEVMGIDKLLIDTVNAALFDKEGDSGWGVGGPVGESGMDMDAEGTADVQTETPVVQAEVDTSRKDVSAKLWEAFCKEVSGVDKALGSLIGLSTGGYVENFTLFIEFSAVNEGLAMQVGEIFSVDEALRTAVLNLAIARESSVVAVYATTVGDGSPVEAETQTPSMPSLPAGVAPVAEDVVKKWMVRQLPHPTVTDYGHIEWGVVEATTAHNALMAMCEKHPEFKDNYNFGTKMWWECEVVVEEV